jgi:hypothetical protein
MIDPDTSLIEGAFAVCTALDAAGFTAVLCGGSAATFYAPDAYMSADNDFVLTVELSRREISAIIAPLGFREQGRIYVHDAVGWSVDFPRGPLAIGREVVTKWSTERRNDQVLHVITATDSVRDRFMHYWAWNDYSGLVQAIAVAKAQPDHVDRDAFRAWTEAEIEAAPIYDRHAVDTFFKTLDEDTTSDRRGPI